MTLHQNCTKCANIPGFWTYLFCCVRDAGHYPAERRMLGYVVVSTIILGVISFIFARAFLAGAGGTVARIIPLLPYIVLSVTAIGGAVWHFKSVRRDVSDMLGMMVGMTFGMIAGFLAGYFVGATNGMFTGSVLGMIIGMGLGWYAGDCCAMMGKMEGLMAGLMSGTMGAMIAVMLLNDRLNVFTPILFIATMFILLGLTYLVHREHRAKHGIEVHYTGVGLGQFIALSGLIEVVVVAVMIFGPRSSLFFGL